MNRRLAPVVAIAIVTVAPFMAILPPVAADDAKAAATVEEVRRLIDELGAPTRSARTAAEKRLLEIGSVALVHLPPPELLTSVSVRESVDRIRHELERRQARESMRPSVVTLQGTRPLRDWIDDLSRQSRNSLDARGLPDTVLKQSITLDVKEHQFWPTLDEILSRNRLFSEPESAHRGLRLLPEDGKHSPFKGVVGYAGPFRLSVPPAELIAFGKPNDPLPQKRLVRVELFAQPEPRLRPLFLQFASADISADGGNGALKSFNPEASYELVVNEAGGRSRMQLDFVVPPGETPKRLDLRGSFRMTTAADSAAVRFIEISKPADGKFLGIERRRGGATVSLQRVRRERKPDGTNELRIAIAVAYDSGGPAFESHRTWILHNEVFLEAGDSRQPLNGGYETTLQADGAVGMEYRFVDLPDPIPEYAFVYMVPTLIVDVPVRFALESVAVRAQD